MTFRCITFHVIHNASFESDNLGKGTDILTYDKKAAWSKGLEPLIKCTESVLTTYDN